jgi:hypothetical protein
LRIGQNFLILPPDLLLILLQIILANLLDPLLPIPQKLLLFQKLLLIPKIIFVLPAEPIPIFLLSIFFIILIILRIHDQGINLVFEKFVLLLKVVLLVGQQLDGFLLGFEFLK